jgi:hypothetical protein
VDACNPRLFHRPLISSNPGRPDFHPLFHDMKGLSSYLDIPIELTLSLSIVVLSIFSLWCYIEYFTYSFLCLNPSHLLFGLLGAFCHLWLFFVCPFIYHFILLLTYHPRIFFIRFNHALSSILFFISYLLTNYGIYFLTSVHAACLPPCS